MFKFGSLFLRKVGQALVKENTKKPVCWLPNRTTPRSNMAPKCRCQLSVENRVASTVEGRHCCGILGSAPPKKARLKQQQQQRKGVKG